MSSIAIADLDILYAILAVASAVTTLFGLICRNAVRSDCRKKRQR